MLTGSKGWAPPLLHQAITDSQFGQQNVWSGRIDLNLFAQFADDDAQVMRVIEVRATLNLLHDLLTRHNLAGFPRENLQHQIFLSTEDKYLPSIVPERVAKLISRRLALTTGSFADVAAEGLICGRARRWRQFFFS